MNEEDEEMGKIVAIGTRICCCKKPHGLLLF